MSTPKAIRTVVSAIALLALPAAALAGDRPDVDIESLRGEVWLAGYQWLLEVRYDVEIEERLPAPGELELILLVDEDDRRLHDRAGLPLQFVVPLVHPSEVDEDEIEFEDRTTVTLPDGSFYDPDDLRLEAVVVYAGDDYPLAHKRVSVKFDRPRPPRRVHLGVRVGAGFGVRVGAGVGVSLGSVRHHGVRTHHRRVVRRHVGPLLQPTRIGHRQVGARHNRAAIGHRHAGARHDRAAIGRMRGHVTHRRPSAHGRHGHPTRRTPFRPHRGAVRARP